MDIIGNGQERLNNITEKSKRRRVTKDRSSIDGCFDCAKPHIKIFIEVQLKKMEYTKVILTLEKNIL